MKDIYTLGIESSCDETSVSVVKNGREVLSNVINSQVPIHEKFGGVVPEIASRNHTEAISSVTKKALEEAKVTFDDYIMTQAVHLEFFRKNNDFYIEHIDHEIIFYTFDEYDNRLCNIKAKGKVLKRQKTFKIDNSEIPFFINGKPELLIQILYRLIVQTFLILNMQVAVVFQFLVLQF